jgi:hypothetical protein
MSDVAQYGEDLSPEELAFQRVYGPLEPFSLVEAAEVLDGVGLSWWVVGGVAIEAFTGVPRHHEDIDLSILRHDLPRLRDHLAPHFHLWAAGPGLLHLADGTEMPAESEQVWLREHALAPWRCEFLLNTDVGGRWQSKRDPGFTAPLEEVTWVKDGIRYLNPELVLSHKAKASRPKDDDDLGAAWPLLDEGQRAFLVDFLERCQPAHPWLARLAHG